MASFKFDGPTPEVIAEREAIERQEAIERFLEQGGNIVECPPVPTPRVNTAR